MLKMKPKETTKLCNKPKHQGKILPRGDNSDPVTSERVDLGEKLRRTGQMGRTGKISPNSILMYINAYKL